MKQFSFILLLLKRWLLPHLVYLIESFNLALRLLVTPSFLSDLYHLFDLIPCSLLDFSIPFCLIQSRDRLKNVCLQYSVRALFVDRVLTKSSSLVSVTAAEWARESLQSCSIRLRVQRCERPESCVFAVCSSRKKEGLSAFLEASLLQFFHSNVFHLTFRMYAKNKFFRTSIPTRCRSRSPSVLVVSMKTLLPHRRFV